MLSIANEVNSLIFYYVHFVCNTNYVFSTISYLFHSLLLKLSNKIISILFIPLKLSNKIIKRIFQNDCFFFFCGIFLLSTSPQLPLDSSFFQYVLEVIFLIPFFIILFWVLVPSFFFFFNNEVLIHTQIFNKKKRVFFFLSNIFFIILFFYSIK